MATKKTNNQLDKFDFDDDIFGDDLDLFGDSNQSTPKGPVRTFVSSFGVGAKETVRNASVIRSLAAQVLPAGYGSLINVSEDALFAGRKLYDEAASELKPALPALRSAIGKVYAATEGKLPDRIRDLLKEYSEDGDSYRVPTQAEIDEEEITKNVGNLSQLLLANSKAASRRAASERAERLIRSKVEDKQQLALLGLMADQTNLLNRMVGYQDKVEHPWRQKTLELAYRRTFFARDQVVLQREQLGILRDGFKALVHNTALPDYEKKSTGQAARESFRDRLLGSAQTAASKYVSGFTDNITKNLQSKVKELFGGFSMALQSGSGLSDQLSDAAGMMPGGKLGMAGHSAGEAMVKFIAPYLGMIPQKLFARHRRFNRSGGALGLGISQLPEIVQQWAQSDTDTTSIRGNIEQIFKELFRNDMVQETKVGSSPILNADRPVPFDSLSRRSLIEVIPGWLARIHQSTEGIRTGKEAPLMKYNLDRGRFTTVREASEDARNRMFNKNNVYQVQQSLNEVIDRIDDGSLPPELRAKLAKKILGDTQKLVPINEKYFSEGALAGSFSADEIANIRKAFTGRMYDSAGNLNYRRMQGLVDSSSAMRQRTFDPMEMMRVYRETGNVELLEELGLVSSSDTDGMGRVDRANYDRIYDLMLSGEGIAPEKKKEVDNALTRLGKKYGNKWDRKSSEIAHRIYTNRHYRKAATKVGDIAGDVMRKGRSWLKNRGTRADGFDDLFEDHNSYSARDIYTAGNPEPVMTAEEMVNGEYRDQATGETIERVEDIKGPVIDSNDRVVLSAKTMIKGVFDSSGKHLKNLSVVGRNYLQSIRDNLKKSKVGGLVSGGKGAWKKAIDDTAENIKDVYVDGKTAAVLTAEEMRLGEYRDQLTGKIIRTIDDITGPVIDSEGNVRLPAADFFRGIRDKLGNKLNDVASRAKSRIEGLTQAYNQAAHGGPTSGTVGVGQENGAVGEQTASRDQYQQELLELNAKQLETLIEINESIRAISVLGGDGSGVDHRPWYAKGISKATGGIRRVGGALSKGVLGYFRGAYKLQWAGLKGAVGAGVGTLGAAKDLLFSGRRRRASDIYVKGRPDEPVLFRTKMLREQYIDKNSGKVVKGIDSITGPVIDRETGDYVLTQEDWDQGIYDLVGRSVTGRVMKGLRGLAGSVGQYYLSVFSAPFKILKIGTDFGMKALSKINEEQDVYLKGRLDKPVMLNKDIKAGKYWSMKKKRPIRSYKEVDGEIRFIDGDVNRIAITEEEAHTLPLVNWRGKPLQTMGQGMVGLVGSAAGLAGRAALGLVKGYASVVGAVMGAGKNVIVGTAKRIGRFFNPKGHPIGSDEKTIELLTDILNILDSRLAKPKKIRKGSWEEIFARRKSESEAEKASKKEDERANKFGLGSMMGWIGSKFKGLFGGGDDDEDGEGGGNTTILGGGGGKDKKGDKEATKAETRKRRMDRLKQQARRKGKLGFLFRGKDALMGAAGKVPGAGVLTKGGRMLGGPGKLALGVAGALGGSWLLDKILGEDTEARKAAGTAATVGGGVLTASWLSGLLGGPTISSVAGGAASALGGIGAGAGAMTLGIPIAIGAAVGYAGYKGYKSYKYGGFTPLRGFRMTQYGVDYNYASDVEKIMNLESMVEKSVRDMGSGLDLAATADLTMEDIYKEMGLDDGWFGSNAEERASFDVWFNARFKPVYLKWMTSLRGIKSGVPLNEAEEKLNPEEQKRLLGEVKSINDAVYGVRAGPFGSDTSIGASRVKEVLAKAESELKDIGEGKGGFMRGVKSINRAMFGSNIFGQQILKGMDYMDEKGANIRKQLFGTEDEAKKGDGAGLYTALTAAVKVSPLNRGLNQLTAMQSVRYKAYGLSEMELFKVALLKQLELLVGAEVTHQAGNEVKYPGTTREAFEKYGELFGIATTDYGRRTAWEGWFANRFMPVLLTYVSACKQFSTTIDPWADELNLSATDQLIVAKSMIAAKRKVFGFSLSIWSYTTSPWGDDAQNNTEPKSTDENLLAIQNEASKRKVDQVRASVATPTQDQKPASPGTARSLLYGGPGREGMDGSVGRDGSAVNQGYDPARDADAQYWRSKGVDPNSILMVNNRPMAPLGTAVRHPGNGTGGDINNIPAATGDGLENVRATIEAAAKMVGVDPGLMLTMANIESSFRPGAKAGTSSASGLFQFINSTWRDMLRKYASKYGIDPNTSPFDARANALMGGEYVRENYEYLKKKIGREPTDTDLYAAHFMGRGGAVQLLTTDPNAIASAQFPEAARANQSIFYTRSSPRTARGVMEELERRVKTRRVEPSGTTATDTAIANTSAPDAQSTSPVAPVPPALPGIQGTSPKADIGNYGALAQVSRDMGMNSVRDENMRAINNYEQMRTEQSVQRGQFEADAASNIQRDMANIARKTLEAQLGILEQTKLTADGIATLVKIASKGPVIASESDKPSTATALSQSNKSNTRQPAGYDSRQINSPVSVSRSRQVG